MTLYLKHRSPAMPTPERKSLTLPRSMGSPSTLLLSLSVLCALALHLCGAVPCHETLLRDAPKCAHYKRLSQSKLPVFLPNQSAEETCGIYSKALDCVYGVLDQAECTHTDRLSFDIQRSAVDHMCSRKMEYKASAECFGDIEGLVETCMQRMVKSVDRTKRSMCWLFSETIRCAFKSVLSNTAKCQQADAMRMGELLKAYFRPSQQLIGCDIAQRDRRELDGASTTTSPGPQEEEGLNVTSMFNEPDEPDEPSAGNGTDLWPDVFDDNATSLPEGPVQMMNGTGVKQEAKVIKTVPLDEKPVKGDAGTKASAVDTNGVCPMRCGVGFIGMLVLLHLVQ